MFELIRANKIKSGILIVALSALLVVLGYVVGEAWGYGGVGGVVIAAVIAMVLSGVAYFAGGDIMLAMSRARQIEHADHPQLSNVVEEMSLASGLPMPKIYIIDDTALNAFATGRSPETASVAITKGLLMRLNRDELQGVMAHEMGHVLNRDILFMTLAGILLGAIVLIADFFRRSLWYGGLGGRRRRSSQGRDGGAQAVMAIVALVLSILAPILARILYLACSRRREYLADATAARLTRYPEGLASALEKLASDREVLEGANRATAPMYIVPPVMAASGGGISRLFSTHPPTEERIAILRAMGTGASAADYQRAYSKLHEGKSVVPASALADKAPVPVRQAAQRPTQAERLQQAHDALDMVRRHQHFLVLTCACGATLKIPPGLTGPTVTCPRCHATHSLSDAKPADQPPAPPPPPPGQGPRVIHCSCGHDIPIPPGYARPRTFCPKCNATHDVADAEPA